MKSHLFLIIATLVGCSQSKDTNTLNNKPTDQLNVTTSIAPDMSESDKACSTAFESTIENLNAGQSFKPLFDFYKNNANCMDGAYSQGIEGAISKALDQNWDNLKELDGLFSQDSKFKVFLYENIGCYVSATESHLEAVSKKAKESCPSELKKLCSEILAASEKALGYAKAQ